MELDFGDLAQIVGAGKHNLEEEKLIKPECVYDGEEMEAGDPFYTCRRADKSIRVHPDYLVSAKLVKK